MPTPNDALSYAKRFMGNMPVDDATIKYRLLDDAHKKLWMSAPWPWTVGALEVVTLVNGTQDYALSAPVSDLYCLQHVSVVGPTTEKNDLKISAVLPTTTLLRGQPSQVMYLPGTPQKVRVLPVPYGYSTLPKLLSVYKKTAVDIAAGNVEAEYSLLGLPDEWFWVYQELVLLKAYQFTHDQRLGSITVAPGGTQYSGQYAAVEDGIQAMKRAEEKFFSTLGEVINA